MVGAPPLRECWQEAPLNCDNRYHISKVPGVCLTDRMEVSPTGSQKWHNAITHSRTKSNPAKTLPIAKPLLDGLPLYEGSISFEQYYRIAKSNSPKGISFIRVSLDSKLICCN